MGIEMRKSGTPYYYRKRWIGGRCRSEYVASGPVAVRLWQHDQLLRSTAQARAAEKRQEREQLAAWEGEARAIERQAAELARMALLASGYHQHKRQWRRRRYHPMTAQPRRHTKPADLPPLPPPDDTSDSAVKAILARIAAPGADEADFAALRRLFALPVVPKRVEYLLHICHQVQLQIVDCYSSGPLAREGLLGEIRTMRRRLGWDEAPELERSLIDHVVTCWMRLQLFEYNYSVRVREPHAVRDMEPWERRIDFAQRRYLRAAKMLADVQRVRVELVRVTSPDGTRAEGIAIERPASRAERGEG